MKILKLFIIGVVAYFAIEVGSAFLPGGAVQRNLADPHHCYAQVGELNRASCLKNEQAEANHEQ